ncbi:hypothetical protein [Candidatus Accumulibacter vicinus]|uniref:PhoU domain-containing protein n=1 Tax=Candidatus Accumulibacter vicinus TaxID=2954382 RepID=A0A084XYK0_9PROT|nr:hypothetical protein [Candidatus Accumulibacter vicinus]KFB67544.1 MAG: hypothetical protein CAPSK01_002987 [Candidatus Accumulibacter vicinus]
MTTIAVSQVVSRVRSSVGAADTPDFFSMIDQQARMIVNLARVVADVLQGKESAHSLRLIDLEQHRQELQRRHQAVVDSLPHSGLEEIRSTMEALDRAAAVLIRTARDCLSGGSNPDATVFQMMGVIRKAIESLRHGYTRLANGSTVAEFDADAAIASQRALVCWRTFDDQREVAAAEGWHRTSPSGVSPDRSCRLNGLYENLYDIARELSRAGVILKVWSRRLYGAVSPARLPQ